MNCAEFTELAPLYFSGELDARHSTQLSQHLKACQECAQEFEQQERLDTRLKEAVLADHLDTSALDARVRAQMAASQSAANSIAHSSRLRWRLAIAAALLLMVAGGIGYRALLSSRVPQVYADAADDHMDEVVARQPRRWVSDRAAIEALATKQNVPAHDVAALEAKGYRLERAKICSLDNERYLHLVYSSDGKEFSVFLRGGDSVNLSGPKRENVSGKQIYESDRGDAHVAGVRTDSVTAFIVTEEPGDAVLRIAEAAVSGF